ncbi:Sec-independent protein translocase protein TatA [Salirhabdus euzebyi]|uniref:Sec-independent protein translocase protein TatA n=1 Tax=Salirhabdus euzebyi TaxID=394506 RepID=A0A841Q937_9BACI|nr:YlbD family protein [Salirhabdus euzebyi]MBB6455001.1 Sec-independent protein translocase protein TatA [Salirhabdus euzebyi]
MGNLHPKVSKFKAFVEKHPKLIKQVRKNKEGWQPYFEKWVLYGEEDEYWKQFKSESEKEKKKSESKASNQELLKKLSSMFNNMDMDKLQEQMNQLNGVITNVQSMMTQFQQNKQQNQNQNPNVSQQNRPNPFHFGKD